MERFKIELKRRRLLPKVKLPKIVLPKLWKLPRRLLLPERVLPQIDLPHVLIDFPEEVTIPWKEMEIERVEVVPLKPRDFKIIFRRIPVAERQIKQEGDQTENQILEFLKQHPEETYKCHEVTKGIGLTDRGVPKLIYARPDGLGIEGTLNELVKKGLVDKKIIDRISRYSIHGN